ncbi:MAG: hypothetical protein Q7T10_18235 [Rhodoferax sp.]|nr:hypothetical protein [Rhodoferax sp.]
MRGVLGVLSLLIVVAVIGLLAKKQVGALPGAGIASGTSVNGSVPVVNPQQQSQQLQKHVKRSVEDAMKQARPEVEDK